MNKVVKGLALTVILAATSAHARTAEQVGKGVIDAGKALRGGRAAVGSAVNAGKAMDAVTASAAIMKATTASDSVVAAFESKLAKIKGVDGSTMADLKTARRVTVLDDGCLDTPMAAVAYKNLAASVSSASAQLARSNQTIDGLARIAKNSDINGDGQVSADEQAESNRAEDTLRSETREIVGAYQKVMNLEAAAAVKGIQELSGKCGVNPAIGARAGL